MPGSVLGPGSTKHQEAPSLVGGAVVYLETCPRDSKQGEENGWKISSTIKSEASLLRRAES